MKPIKLDSPFSFLPLALITFSLLFFIGITGCKNLIINPSENTLRAYSEKDFRENANLRAAPNAVVAVNLEDLNSPPNDSIPDTGSIGIDEIYFRYTENVIKNFRMENSQTFSVSLVNVETHESPFYIDWNNVTVSAYIPAGDYKMILHSWRDFTGDSTIISKTVFIEPESYNSNDIFITTGGCPNCNLSYINLDHMHLNNLSFYGANLLSASMSGANINFSNFSTANMNNAYLFMSSLQGASLSHGNLQSIVLRGCDLQNADLGASDLSNADLRFANASGTNFCGSNLTGIIYNGITVNEQTQCFP